MSTFNYKIPGELEREVVPRTLWQKIFLHLKEKGYKVYSPGQKRDKCETSYVVIKENGVHALVGNVAGYKLFDIIIYHPISNYSSMEFYMENIKQAIKEIEDLRPTGNETSSIIDSEVDAYTASIEYQQFKRLRR